MRLIEYGPLQSNLKDPEAKWGKREGGRSMAPSDFHLAPLEEFHFERARKNVRERFSSASPWSSLVVGDEGWIGPSRKLLCLC